MYYLAELRQKIVEYGSSNIVYFDESGFQHESIRENGWAKRGVKVHGRRDGNNRKSVNLIMAQQAKNWLAPMLFKGDCNKDVVLNWFEQMLLPELKNPSVIIMDNARFHDKAKMSEIARKNGHIILPLPPYSPDFNPIEKSFAVIKKRRQFSNHENALENILMGNL